MAFCIPVPRRMEQLRPDAEKHVFLPPNGNMFDDKVRSAEVLAEANRDHGALLHVYFQLDNEELETLQKNDGIIELTVVGEGMPPLAVKVI